MAVDMYPSRFLTELKIAHPEPRTKTPHPASPVWGANFPAWRPVFTAQCLLGHTQGYKLPSFPQFHDAYRDAFLESHDKRYKRNQDEAYKLLELFTDHHEVMLERIWVWYDSGMAETWAYLWMVRILEDKVKRGLAAYDARVDFKHKMDFVILDRDHQTSVKLFYKDGTPAPARKFMGKIIPISTFNNNGNSAGREGQLAERDRAEMYAKRNTSESSNKGHSMEHVEMLEIVRSANHCYNVRGVELFNYAALSTLLSQVMDALEYTEEQKQRANSHFAEEALKCKGFTP